MMLIFRISQRSGVDGNMHLPTANVMSNDREECLQIGMNDYIAKPMRLTDIIKILKSSSTYFPGKKLIN